MKTVSAAKNTTAKKTTRKAASKKDSQVRFNVSTLIKQYSISSSSISTEEELFGLLSNDFTIRPWENQGRVTGWYICKPESTSNPLGFITWGLHLNSCISEVKSSIEALKEIYLSDISIYTPKQ